MVQPIRLYVRYILLVPHTKQLAGKSRHRVYFMEAAASRRHTWLRGSHID